MYGKEDIKQGNRGKDRKLKTQVHPLRMVLRREG